MFQSRNNIFNYIGILFTIGIQVVIHFNVKSQQDTSFHARIEAQVYASDTGITPFWMRSLQYGQVPLENPGAVVRAWAGKNYQWKKKYDWKYELEATGWGGKQNDFWFTQAYVSGRRGKWELWAGRRKEIYGLGDSSLTGGFYAWSGNAVPIPKVQIGTRDYINLAKGWLGVHMTFSHGWMDNQGPTLNGFLHQKSLYGRFGKPESFINVFAGLNHQVMWGGEAKVKTGGDYDYYPSSLNTYFYVVTVLKDREIVPTDTISRYDDLGNQFGNHLGSFDLAVKFQPKGWEVLVYKQSAYETGRGFALTQINDGLTGISIKNKSSRFIDKITLEYLYTANQGNYISGLAEFLKIKDPHQIEIESYFYNGRGGWQYWGKGIGTPLIIIDRESQQGGGYNFTLNAVKSFYLGLSGSITKTLSWQSRISSSYYASPRNHLLPRLSESDFISQFSGMISFQKTLNEKCSLNLQFGYDEGRRVKNTLGGSLGIKYSLF
ncbi:capsule assembly Wzi family protein [Aquirufa aurantiipilula]|uniref:capsule assembly Wzi family protein n=1 Tax=Aquirufa aurantiipilula TaxID=2696561 RepID=UPI001CAA6354|nr:capsule assembly Wzi family protein [Aquirufa aurantiipilula]MBZ1326561.1 capsule assembly Wzi family protein [Aquirufa aurantiipilula]